MRYLLDTHMLLCALYEPQQIAPALSMILNDTENSFFVSHASIWEIAQKQQTGLITHDPDLTATIAASALEWLPITVEHLDMLMQLAPMHKDPFDRMLVAQARCEGLVIVTTDPWISLYDVPVLRNI